MFVTKCLRLCESNCVSYVTVHVRLMDLCGYVKYTLVFIRASCNFKGHCGPYLSSDLLLTKKKIKFNVSALS